LTSLLVESLLFGCFAVLYLISLWILVFEFRRRSHGSASMGIWLCVVVTFMVVLAMGHLVLDGDNIIRIFSQPDASGSCPGASLSDFASPSQNARLIAGMTITAVLSLVGDSFMLYRIFVVWDRAWRPLILPIVCILGMLSGAIACQYEFYHAGPSLAEALYTPGLYMSMVTYLTCSLAANLSILALLVGRLLWYDRAMRRYRLHARPSLTRRVARTIVQSEAMHSTMVIINLAAYAARSDSLLVATNALPSLIGISFTLIITHFGLYELAEGARGGLCHIDVETPDTAVRRVSHGRSSLPLAFSRHPNATRSSLNDDGKDQTDSSSQSS
ncbi:hypothetical protein BD413DRAFT_482908, partial [Trametes elegans]